jgi:uncharacterized protein GlcG (DUF336 family)
MTAPLGAVNGLTLAEARTILDGASAEGRRLGLKPLTIVVLDAGGHLKAAERQDGCSLMREGIARGKAFGALAMGFGGRELARRAAQMGPFMNALSDMTGGMAVPVPGGVLVRRADGTLLGAVGVSGDVSAQDEAAAVAGIRAAGLVADTGDAA